MIKITKTPEFEQWLENLRIKEQAQIEAFGHFGDVKPLQGSDYPLFELRWKNGWRIYFYREEKASIKLLAGGKKNDQKKNIKKAGILLRRYAHLEE